MSDLDPKVPLPELDDEEVAELLKGSGWEPEDDEEAE
jgi:hypothetical protein